MSDYERSDVNAAVAAVGSPVHPGRVRILTCGGSARIQQQWIGPHGEIWIDVPKIAVDYLTPNQKKSGDHGV